MLGSPRRKPGRRAFYVRPWRTGMYLSVTGRWGQQQTEKNIPTIRITLVADMGYCLLIEVYVVMMVKKTSGGGACHHSSLKDQDGALWSHWRILLSKCNSKLFKDSDNRTYLHFKRFIPDAQGWLERKEERVDTSLQAFGVVQAKDCWLGQAGCAWPQYRILFIVP